jgi:hypothetical protein
LSKNSFLKTEARREQAARESAQFVFAHPTDQDLMERQAKRWAQVQDIHPSVRKFCIEHLAD